MIEGLLTKLFFILIGVYIYLSHISWLVVNRILEDRYKKEVKALVYISKIIGVTIIILSLIGLIFDFYFMLSGGKARLKGLLDLFS